MMSFILVEKILRMSCLITQNFDGKIVDTMFFDDKDEDEMSVFNGTTLESN